MPFSGPIAISMLAIATCASISFLWIFPPLTGDNIHHLIDVIAVTPITLITLAIWTQFAWSPNKAKENQDAAEDDGSRDAPDVVQLWRNIGALSADSTPLYVDPGHLDAEPEANAPSIAWRNALGQGPCPRALEELFATWRAPDQGWLVPDLPAPTERIFLTSALLLAIREHGLPCLVVADDPHGLRDAVAAAIQRSGAWSCGPLVVGEAGLRSAFASKMPAAAFLDIEELSAEGIRALAGNMDSAGSTWCRNIGLLFLSQVDRGNPLEVTHRLFTLQRLGLAMRTAEAQWSILATGFGGESTRAMVERAFPGVPMREVPLGPRASAEVRLWLTRPEFRKQGGDPWVKRAVEPVVQTGFPVSVSDPGGAFGKRGIDIWGADIQLLRDVSFAGQASASALDEAWLVASFRSIHNRLPLEKPVPHDALWGLADNPVTRFLTRNNNLHGLLHAKQLKPPKTLFGASNRLVARTHLKAALRECQQDTPTLEGIFGRSLVDEVLGKDFVPVRHAVRRIQGQLQRVPMAPLLPNEAAPTLRSTVAQDVVLIKHKHSGERLEEVDRVCAVTRYYPERVFSVGADRFRVPPHHFDAKRAEILVEPVDSQQPLTRPFLTIDVTDPILVEAPQEYREAGMLFTTATFEATARESIAGVRYADGSTQHYKSNHPVTAEYRTRVRGIFFNNNLTHNALYHLSRSFDGVLVAHLFAREEDLEVFPIQANFYGSLPAGILVVDRFIHGMGMAEALSNRVVRDVLHWVKVILAKCQCPHGCESCTPWDVLQQGPDKPGVLKALGR